MKNIKYIILFILTVGMFNSCLINNETDLDENDLGNNLVSFEKSSIIYSQVATGDEYPFTVQIRVKGPTSMDMTADIPVTIEVDASSTAIAGTHFRIPDNKLTLKASNNYFALLEVVMLTAGIVAPLPVDPQLVLNITTTGGGENIVADGNPVKVTLVYGCLSHMEGTYTTSTVYTAYDGTVTNLTPWTEDITKTGVEEYRTGRVGHWTPAALGGNPGFTFLNKCDALTVPGQNLVDLYGNWVLGTGARDDATDDLHFDYSICYPAGSDNCRYYVVDMVRVK